MQSSTLLPLYPRPTVSCDPTYHTQDTLRPMSANILCTLHYYRRLPTLRPVLALIYTITVDFNWTASSATTSFLAFARVPCGHLLHEADVVVLRQMPVFLQIRSFVGGHAGEEVFDEFVGNERVAEIEFGDVRL